jgi:hypothetical protein
MTNHGKALELAKGHECGSDCELVWEITTELNNVAKESHHLVDALKLIFINLTEAASIFDSNHDRAARCLLKAKGIAKIALQKKET